MGAYKLNLGSATEYLKWDGAHLWVKGSITIIGGSGIANLTDAGDLALLNIYGDIPGPKPPINADYFGGVAGAMAYENLVELAKLGTTVIVGGYIKTSLLTANNIRVGTLDTVRLNVGSGTNNDIYFKDSGIRLYDAGSQSIVFSRSGYKSLNLYLSTSGGGYRVIGDYCDLGTTSRLVRLHGGGAFQLCNVYSEPAGYAGAIAYNSSKHRFQCYIGGATNAWGYELMSAGW